MMNGSKQAGRHAVVLGGCGNVGSGVVGGFLRRDYAKVVVISRSPLRLDQLRKTFPQEESRLIFIVGDVSSEEGATCALNEVMEQCQGRIDDVVSCIGFSWWQRGLLKDQSKLEIESAFNSLVIAPFVAYKTFIRSIEANPEATYTFVTGGGADMFLAPGTGMMSIGGGAAQGLARVALKEHAKSPVTVTEVSFLAGVSPCPEKMPQTFVWIHNQNAGDAITSVVAKRSGRARTSTIMTLEDLEKLIVEGIL